METDIPNVCLINDWRYHKHARSLITVIAVASGILLQTKNDSGLAGMTEIYATSSVSSPEHKTIHLRDIALVHYGKRHTISSKRSGSENFSGSAECSHCHAGQELKGQKKAFFRAVLFR